MKSCAYELCDKELVGKQKKFCSISHRTLHVRPHTYVQGEEARWRRLTCVRCQTPRTGPNIYCSSACREAEWKDTVLSYCVIGAPQVKNTALKKHLVNLGLLEAQCCWCGLTEWRGRSGLEAPLQLDHVNGDSHDNRLENLRILCGNCHMQTDTYCGRNKKNKYGRKSKCAPQSSMG